MMEILIREMVVVVIVKLSRAGHAMEEAQQHMTHVHVNLRY
jgi:hypothetical protein